MFSRSMFPRGAVLGLAILSFLAVALPALAATHNVSVSNFQFTPATLNNIAVGDVVRWNWVQGIHTTSSGIAGEPGAGAIWDAPIDGDNTFFERTFDTPGSFPYHCVFHGVSMGMTGMITVSGNIAPVVQNPGTKNGTEEVFFSVTVTATDADPLTMSDGGTTPSWATFVDNGNKSATISGTPALGQAGTYPVTVTASDGLLSDSETFNIVIASANITIVNLEAGGFVPSAVTIQPGHKVRWVRQATGNHTTTNGTGLADPQAGTIWDAQLRAATPTFTFQFASAGVFPYFCRNDAATETGTVTVESSPTCTVSGPDPVCAGTTGNAYTASVSPSGGTVTFSWSISGNGSIVGTLTGSSVTVTAGAAGSFTLTQNGLRNGTAFQCAKTVTVNANPTCTVNGPAPVEQGTTGHVYTATLSPVGGTVLYAWSITGDGSITGSTTGSSVTVNAGSPGSYNITLNTTRNGCPGQCAKAVTVNASAVAATIQVMNFQFMPKDVTILVGQKVKWQWVNGMHTTTNGVSSSAEHNPGSLWDTPLDSANTSFIYEFTSAGYFPFFCRPHEPDGMKGSVQVLATTGADDGTRRPRPGLFPSPNPFLSKVDLHIVLEREAKVALDIFDLSGRRVLGLLVADLPAGGHRVTWGGWDGNHQPVVPGVYFARLSADGRPLAVQKLFKTR